MVGIAYNPDNCAFISNQARNTNQFNDNVPYSSNSTTHLVLWDFVAEKLYWVNSLTNIIDAEIPGASACDFIADINYVGESDPGYIYTCVPTNGTAPYTYEWTLRAEPQVDFTIPGATNTQNVTVVTSGVLGQEFYIGLLQCRVTDAEGCKTTAVFTPYVFVGLPPIP